MILPILGVYCPLEFGPPELGIPGPPGLGPPEPGIPGPPEPGIPGPPRKAAPGTPMGAAGPPPFGLLALAGGAPGMPCGVKANFQPRNPMTATTTTTITAAMAGLI